MGLTDFFKRTAQALAPEQELFDEEFQRKLDYLAVISRRLFAGRLRAERRTKKTGSGIEFADHREYSAGDDLRYLDWKVFGRSERMLLKLFEEEEDLSIYVLLDCSESMAFGTPSKFDHGRKLAAALAYVGLANLDRVALVAISTKVDKTLPTTRGKGRIFKIFDFLRSVRTGGTTALADAARMFTAQQKRRGIAIVITDLYDPEGFERGINAIRYRKFEPIVVHLIDPREADPGARGDVTLVDVETGESREITLTDGMVRAYREAHLSWRKEIDDFCTSRRVPYVAADVTEPFEDQVLRLFRRLAVVE
ncbi:MAG: DUF58 domain-containing protein [Deltaproteobacteria bacterium]|nr:DUF58 domain-containing protein [Deltaproteobacteria bacterium]